MKARFIYILFNKRKRKGEKGTYRILSKSSWFSLYVKIFVRQPLLLCDWGLSISSYTCKNGSIVIFGCKFTKTWSKCVCSIQRWRLSKCWFTDMTFAQIMLHLLNESSWSCSLWISFQISTMELRSQEEKLSKNDFDFFTLKLWFNCFESKDFDAIEVTLVCIWHRV